MNRNQAKAWEGQYVKWDWWPFKENTCNAIPAREGMLHHMHCVGEVWYLIKVTKGGMCQISKEINGTVFVTSVMPSALSEFEYPWLG